MDSPQSPRILAIKIAKIINECNRASNFPVKSAIEKELGLGYSALSMPKNKYAKGFKVLEDYECIEKMEGKGGGYKLVRPLEDINAQLVKWGKRKKNIKEKVHIMKRATPEFKPGPIKREISGAKCIRMQINNVSLTIEF